uniref:Transmembrane protein n=1 Tax=Pseudopediastrum integrum TaxID=271402 RepID=A0A2U8GJG5_9CHLO|nr:hypothetical protein [Pseudopediastrum integrum]AWI68827.1 hypothetical protein [Pseudopediastrum integrum]
MHRNIVLKKFIFCSRSFASVLHSFASLRPASERRSEAPKRRSGCELIFILYFQIVVFCASLCLHSRSFFGRASAPIHGFASVALPLRGSHRCVPQASEGVKHRCKGEKESKGVS